jgi:hypothetical protein
LGVLQGIDIGVEDIASSCYLYKEPIGMALNDLDEVSINVSM